jgi:hypothetical protein
MVKKTNRIEPVNSPPRIKKYDKYLQNPDVQNSIVEHEYYDLYRSPKVNTGRLRNLIFGGILTDTYKGLRRDEWLVKTYGLKTISYGNWVKNEDRFNFLSVLALSLYDLSNLFKSKDLGKGQLTIDWGGIGQGRYKGAFWRDYSLITMPRYMRPDKWIKQLESWGQRPPIEKYFVKTQVANRGTLLSLNKAGKAYLMQTTSGWGSFAHEYGHFMDNVLGKKAKITGGFVTGRMILPNYDQYKKTPMFTELDLCELLFNGTKRVSYTQLNRLERAFFDWLAAMYFQKTKTGYKPNGQYKRLLQATANGVQWKYWASIVELWARTWEIFVSESLSRKGVKNYFLVGAYAKFGRDIRIVDGKPVTVFLGNSVYPTNAHVWANRKVFQNIIDIFVTY